eukprot:CAMPEP_0168489698 /NCGR_PEP_ID=MMETSP0228-20121227/68799_1 /TAXON_ID=133427 /ORGANISM="Protoceratium reticulatum, Strain CCCM 535 (=CCMP 1889)" /LENGTH=78 /DNA_ID=CAMNT_0008506381 /DNA_START=27 /DNA_END=259 /DNA_ORIENTATION=-
MVLLLVPSLPTISTWARRLSDRDYEGILYDDLVKARRAAGLIPSYAPRAHPDFQAAFKLVDFTAAQDQDGSDTTSSSS